MLQTFEGFLTSHLTAKVDENSENSAIQESLSTRLEKIQEALLSS
jgi:hypothetical protein